MSQPMPINQAEVDREIRRQFNCELREAAESPLGTDELHPGISPTIVNEWAGLLGPLDPEDDDARSAAYHWLDDVRALTAQNQLLLSGRVVEASGEVDEINLEHESRYSTKLIFYVSFESLFQAIKERRFGIDPTSMPPRYVYRLGEVATLIGDLVFSTDPTEEGFAKEREAIL